MIVLTPLRKFTFPVNAECINPDIFQGKDTAEIANLTLFEGNKQKKLSLTSSKSKKTALLPQT